MWIAIEGMDGTGKSTISRRLQQHFQEKGKNAIITADPGGWSKGALFRSVILEKRDWKLEGSFQGWQPLARRLLLAADFIQAYNEQISPNLKRGTYVITDRLAYVSGHIYGVADGVPEKTMDALMELIIPERKPDHFFVLDAQDEVLRERLRARSKTDLYDHKSAEFKRNIRKGYNKMVAKYGGLYIDASQSIEKVLRNILQELEKKW